MKDFYEVLEKFKPWNINNGFNRSLGIELISLLLSLGLHKSAASVQNRRNLFDFRISIHFVPPQEIQSQNEVEHHATTEMYKMSKMLEFLLSCSCFFPSKEFVILPPLITQKICGQQCSGSNLFLFLFPYSKLLMEIPICDALDELKSIVMEMCNSHTWYVFGQN